MKLIPLTQGKFAKVDDEDFENLSQFKWFLRGKYASRETGGRARGANGRNTLVIYSMHRDVIDCPEDKHVDHINRDTLDNRKQNLRICTRQENGFNATIRKDNTSGFKGVGYHKGTKKFQARIHTYDKRVRLGYFSTPEEAGEAYRIAARKYHGEFARTA